VLTADTTVTSSLRRDSNARPSPYRGDALSAGATKASAGEARFGRASQGSKDLRDCQLPHSPSRAACRSRTRCLGGTSSALWPDELTRHGYARRELNPHQLGARPSPSTCCGTSAWSLWTASNRLPSPYEEDALPDELQRHGYRSWNRTSVLSGQSRGGMPSTHPVMVRKVRLERTCREV
jgi:hypothetical protein